MDNLTQDTLPMHIDNYSEPVLPDHPIRYVEEHNVRIAILMLMMTPLWVLSGWLTIYDGMVGWYGWKALSLSFPKLFRIENP